MRRSAHAVAWMACALAVAGGARANTQPGSLGADASAAAYYQVTCSDDGRGAPASLTVAVQDTTPAGAPLVSVQVQKGSAARNATDTSDGDATFSPAAFVNGGAGVYHVFVDKTAAGAESFVLSFQCTTGAGGTGSPTGTSIFPSVPQVPLLPFAGWLALVALLAAFAPARASAHTLTGTLHTDAGATDYFQIICSDDGSGPPQSLFVQVRDDPPANAAALISVQAHRGSLLVNSTDPVEGDTTPSPGVSVNGGSGVYDVLIDESAAGDEGYTLTFHCMTGPDGTGVHTGTDSINVQDQ